jgi:ABC-type nitrate/sulfonate/bicarbonate transport system substrate-binding protein
MRRVAAPLAAVLAAIALGGCGDDGAEPGAPKGATLVLDFQPNAVHAGLYAAKERGYFKDEGVDLEIREPSSTADSAKLLEADRADFAILDINDFGIARQEGANIVAFAAIVQRPLAAVIAADADEVQDPADLAGRTVGVTGVPSDDAVLDTVLASGRVLPSAIDRQTIGFKSVPLLAAGKLDAATAFWNAEGVELKELGIPTREFRVEEFGAPRYPELVVATTPEAIRRNHPVYCGFAAGLARGYVEMGKDPSATLDELIEAAPDLDRSSQEAQFEALLEGEAFEPFGSSDLFDTTIHPKRVAQWNEWASENGVVRTPDVGGFKSAQTCPGPEEGD